MRFGFRWQRSRRVLIASLLLPALLFRAAIPAGFMPMVGADGRLTLELCPATVVAQVGAGDSAAAHHAHEAHDHGTHESNSASSHSGAGHHHDSGTAGHDHIPCLFAASAGSAPLPALFALASVAVDRSAEPSDVAEGAFTPTIVRAQTARGPPISRFG